MTFWEQFKRRNAFKVGAAYLTVAFVIAQAATLLEDSLNLNDGFDTVIVRLLILGFPIVLALAWIFELTPQGIRITRDAELSETAGRPDGRVLNFVIIGALSLAVVFLIVDNYVLDEPDRSAIAGPIFREPQGIVANKIAMLPFETLGNAEDPLGVADGIYIDLFDELRNIGFELVGRRTMHKYADSTHTYGEIAAETRSEFVLDLAVQTIRDEIRINATLYVLDGPVETIRWSGVINEDFSAEGLLNLRANVGRTLAEQIGFELLPVAASLTTDLTASNEALTQFLIAKAFLGTVTNENAARCLEPLEQAVMLDREFKEAWYLKGKCHEFRAAIDEQISGAEHESAVSSLRRALEIDPSYSDAAFLLATAFGAMGDWPAAGQAYLTALNGETSSRNDNAFGFLVSIGRWNAALEILLRKFDRDPADLNNIEMSYLQRLLDAAGDRQGSDRVYPLGQGMFPPWNAGRHGRLVVLMGRVRQGQMEHEQLARFARDAYRVSPLPWSGALFENFDDDEAMVELLRNWPIEYVPDRVQWTEIATHAAYFGQTELALDGLKGMTEGLGQNWGFVWSPLFKDVRQLEAFRDHMREIGMFDVWQAVGFPDLCEPVGTEDFRCD